MKSIYYPPETEYLETCAESCFVATTLTPGEPEPMFPENEEDW